ncbi:hypothetical protein [Cohnella rhizosphaerae]|uniref:Uncharacterized protein n=1 Tax=Cohnella rhizosphaerae TaxID=1457232 RepID=A0A9X4QVN4_9BACL|nr:hypothetical protein [Cohnella rhizosphaerae]MDG0813551.1 hypothetical protein [Cohnella rhizosphaerae]
MADIAELTVEPLLDRIYAGDRVLLRATVKLTDGERLIVTQEAEIAVAAEEQGGDRNRERENAVCGQNGWNGRAEGGI